MAKYRRPRSVASPLAEHHVWNAHKAGRRRGVTQASLAIGAGALTYQAGRTVQRRYRKRRPKRDKQGRFR